MREMNPADLDQVVCIEQRVHAHPWTRGNFSDSLCSDSLCKVYEEDGIIVGYAILMPALDEIQLLNISIAAEHQRRGKGHRLLAELFEIARSMHMQRILLEVRKSNFAALRLYYSSGFCEIGLRRDYYLADNGREDAIVMECLL
jgi:ribosomal-protein-alanine N-acetyltransferase